MKRGIIKLWTLPPVIFALAIVLATPALAYQPTNDEPPGIEVTSLPFSHSIDTSDAQIHALEPNSTCVLLGSESVWYNFTPSADTGLVADTFGSDYDTVIDVFQGTLSDNPENPFDALDPIVCNDNFDGFLQSRVQFSAVAGESYLLRVNNPLEVFGGLLTFNLNLATAAPTPPSSAPDGFPSSGGTPPEDGDPAALPFGTAAAAVALGALLLSAGGVCAVKARRQ